MLKLRVVPSLVFLVGIVGLLDKLYWVTISTNRYIEVHASQGPDELRSLYSLSYNFNDFSAFNARAALLNNLTFENVFLDYYFRFPLPQVVYFLMVLLAVGLICRDNRTLIATLATPPRARQKNSPQPTPTCRSCGAPLEPNTAFCGYCGNRIQ